jgi:hypothetical protein
MIREKVSIKDFDRISKENEFFLWNFVTDEMGTHIRPYFEPEDYTKPNPLKSILEFIPIPYFESDLEKSKDFVMNLGNVFTKTVYQKGMFYPVIIGFNRKRVVSSTYSYCYCVEGILDLIGELNPQFILNSNT